MIAREFTFTNRAALAQALATDVARWLAEAVAERGRAVLAVSGGSTPKLFFGALSRQDFAWDKVTITLVDERQVPESSERSNARMVREFLLRNHAGEARFVPLHDNPAAGDIGTFDVAILGMGNDGHTASFFPGGDRLADALDLGSAMRLIDMVAPGADEPRLTFTLRALLAARHLALHIEGTDKRATFARAMSDGPVEEMPVRAVLRAPTPLSLYWCP